MDRSSSQCPNCHRWFSNWRNLKLHISSCRQKYDNKEHGNGIFQHNPLKLSYDFCKSTNDKCLNELIANDQCGKLFQRKTIDNNEMSFSSPTRNNTNKTNDGIVSIPTRNIYAVTQHLLTRRNFIFLNSLRSFWRSLEQRSHFFLFYWLL